MPRKCSSPKFVTREGKLLFFGDAICRSHDGRMAAMYPVIDALPESWPDVLQLIRERRHRYSGEVQFTLFNFIPWDLPDKAKTELLKEVNKFLMNVPTDAGRSAWLCGDQLAHWSEKRDHGELAILLNCLHSARFTAGRLGALHGLQHKLDACGERDAHRILDAISLAASSDKSGRVRWNAGYVLESGGCWNQKKSTANVSRYAHTLFRRIQLETKKKSRNA
jgi:hypothetical protein